MNDSKIAPDQVVGSEIADGMQIGLTTTASPGTVLHSGTESSSGEVWDVITIEACNIDTTNRVLTVAWGGVATKDLVMFTLAPREGRVPIIIKGRLKRGLPVSAWASAADKINVYVEVGVLDDQETV